MRSGLGRKADEDANSTNELIGGRLPNKFHVIARRVILSWGSIGNFVCCSLSYFIDYNSNAEKISNNKQNPTNLLKKHLKIESFAQKLYFYLIDIKMNELLRNIEKNGITHIQSYIAFHCFHIRSIDYMFPHSAKNLKILFNYWFGFAPQCFQRKVYTSIDHLIELKDALHELASTVNKRYVFLICSSFAKISQQRLGFQFKQSRVLKRQPHLQLTDFGMKIDWKSRDIQMFRMSQQYKQYPTQKINECLQEKVRKIKQQHLLFSIFMNLRYLFTELIRISQRIIPKIISLKLLIDVKKQPRFINFQRIQPPQFHEQNNNDMQKQEKLFEQFYDSLNPQNQLQPLQTQSQNGQVNISSCDLRLIFHSQRLDYIIVRQISRKEE